MIASVEPQNFFYTYTGVLVVSPETGPAMRESRQP
jgi:hypothetical protein